MGQKDGVAEYAAEGGKARARSLTKTQRSDIAKRAAAARWGTEPIPRATHAGELKLGEISIPCAVLDNGTRVLSEHGITEAMLGSRSGSSKRARRASKGGGGAPVPLFLAPNNLKPFVSLELVDGPLRPIHYSVGSRLYIGFEATILPAVCDVWLKAREANALKRQQLNKARKAEILMRGLAHVGIIALVDEATGFQDTRARDALAKVLEAFVTKELRKWVKTFPVDYFKELCRLRGVTFPAEKFRLPSYFGHLTNDIVYDRLAPGVRAELNRLTPRDEKGHLKNKLFQRLTEDVGHPKLREHLASSIALMRASDNWDGFTRILDRALPKYAEMPLLDGLEN
jgi:hypothetical protein